MSFVGPHDPFDPPTEWADRFRNVELPGAIPAGAAGKPGTVAASPWRMSEAQIAAARRQYTAAVGLIDAQVGEILAAVEERGFGASTIVVITSDHGEMLGDHGLFQKSVPYESAMRVPLVVAGPGVAPGVSDALIELADLGPTLVGLAGLPPQPGLDARSFAPLLAGHEPRVHRAVAVCRERHYVAIRSATHKYIHNTGTHPLSQADDPDELYDLVADPAEQRNLFLDDVGTAAAVRNELIGTARGLGHCLDRVSAMEAA